MADPLKFTANARYGAAVVGTVFAAYLNSATDFSSYIQASNFAGSIGTDVPLVNFVQFFMIMGLYVASFALMPVESSRRVSAITLACTVLFTWATLGIERGTGTIVQPVGFWSFVLNQGFITVVVALGGWLIVRGRRVGWVAFGLVVIPPLVGRALDLASVTSGAYILVLEGTVLVVGVGGAWLAGAIDAGVARIGRVRGGRSAAASAASAASAVSQSGA